MTDLIEVLDGLGSPRLLVLGDLMLDRSTWGAAERVSPEAAVLVLRDEGGDERPGGAAGVAALARGLGARGSLAGVIGDDAAGRALRRLLDEAGIEQGAVLCDPGRPTTAKERFLARAGGRPAQPLLRVDREERAPLGPAWEERLGAHLVARLASCRALLVSDYGKGVCTPRLLARVIAAARERRVPVLVDPARGADWERYRGADLVAPNRAEAALACGWAVDSAEAAREAGRRLRERHGLGAVLVKLDKDGLALARSGDRAHYYPARPRSVVDVAGAGDMVLAVAGLCRAAGRSWGVAARLANAAAGLEVERPGVVPISRTELRAELSRPGCGGRNKRVSVDEMAALATVYRRAGRRLVFTNGCFDLLHAGHAACLRAAAALGDVLVVAINSDAGVRRLKGAGRPVVGQEERAGLVAALGCVDHVLVFDEPTPHELLRRLRPDVLAKGGDYTAAGVVGREVVESYGGRVAVTGKVDGVSTTQRLAALRGAGAPAVNPAAGNGAVNQRSGS